MANKPNNPSLWSKAKSMAKSKFDVYPSAYANGWASKYYKSKGGTWRKGQQGMQVEEDEEPSNQTKTKRELFHQRVKGGNYDVNRASLKDKQKTVMSQTETAKNILSQPRSVAGGGRSYKVGEAAERTGWDKSQVRKNLPTNFRKYITNPVVEGIKSLAPKSLVRKFPGAMGPNDDNCKGGGCLDMGTESTMKKGGMFKSKSKMKHGGSHSRLKQAYLNKK